MSNYGSRSVGNASAMPSRPAVPAGQGSKLVVQIVGAVAFAHLLNDLIQATLPAIFPMLKNRFHLSFGQIGFVAMVYQFTASLLQPWIGLYTDKHPMPYLLPGGMVVTLVGVTGIALADTYLALIIASAVIGIGSATFHPEASRVARVCIDPSVWPDGIRLAGLRRYCCNLDPVLRYALVFDPPSGTGRQGKLHVNIPSQS